MRESLDPEIIGTPAQLIKLLSKPEPIFNFVLYDFKLSSNWVDIVKDQTIPGIEVSSDANFEEDDNIAGLYPGLYISYIKFTKPVHFVQCRFTGPVNLRNLVFESDFQFFEPSFTESVNIFSSKFLGKTSFRSMTAKQSFTILHSTINSDQLGFRSCTFEDGLAIYACNFINDLDLGDSVFKKMLVIRMGNIAGKLNLAICEIENLQIIGNHETNAPLVVKDINLSDTTVEKQTQINLVTVKGEVKADGAIFQDSVFIDNATFQGKSWWTAVKFDKNLSIQQSAFGDN
ncbi:hypothetical protein [Mucilaginibacter boryungensis]|uniref:Pentapeptide repeat protein n=1 Tax=Mucilaginibacter boryungensis TaxID=768480 RepID=A0ABR9XF41_9SPHI|nr:hypothetical protein [Mucilaginibacter boryungensis]MBE9665683.1 hypothetical protein [Mucilaginibacter boryungensis]